MGKGSVKIYKKRYKKKHNTRKQNRGKYHKKNKTKKSFIKLNCSPKNTKKEYTCYSDDDLYKLRDMWNARHPDIPIKTQNTKKIWEQLKEYYATICNKESCWVRKMTKDSKLEKELLSAFAPESPKEWKRNPNEWLSSIDILKVMNQYEKKYKCFDFLGPSPIDYDTHKLHGECVWEELCHFDLSKHIKKGHTKIGIIFNLDPHYKGGSHWVSLFINVKEKTIFFFDSAGEPVPPQIKKFADNVIKQGKELSEPIHFNFDQNYPVEHQYGNTECGIYSIFFVVYMLQDKISGHYLKTHIIKDKYIEKFRHVFYNGNGDI
jgi:hypothetical protein